MCSDNNTDLLDRSINWNYCILDEGHIIKNTKTKVGYGPGTLSAAASSIMHATNSDTMPILYAYTMLIYRLPKQ